jgi:thiol-disulfide isomerase/thioredoxin
MSVLVAVVTLLSLVCAFHTALLVAVIRRLRHQAELLSEVEERGVAAQALPRGAAVGEFRGRDADGLVVTARPEAETLVAFFSPTCSRCRRERRAFRRVAAGWPGGRARVIAVVSGPAATAQFLAGVARSARIVVDADESIRNAFGIRGFPALFVLSPDGHLTWTGVHAHTVPMTAGRDLLSA